MPFLPLSSTLGTTFEKANVSFKISYIDNLNHYHNVTITPVDINTTINVSSNTISGYYSNSFANNEMYYMNRDLTYDTVHRWEDINVRSYLELIYFFADTTNYKYFNYVAEANGESKLYTVKVNNNWNEGKDQLLKFINMTQYDSLVISWINNDADTVLWTNNDNNTVDWRNN